MAKLRVPIMSMDARGQLGKSLVFLGWKGIKTVRVIGEQKKTKTVVQSDYRTIVANFMSDWMSSPLSSITQAAFDLFLRVKSIRQTIYNYYLSSRITALRTSRTFLLISDPVEIINNSGRVSFYVPFSSCNDGYIQYGYSPRCLSFRAPLLYSPDYPASLYFDISGLQVGKTLYWCYHTPLQDYLLISGIFQSVIKSVSSTTYLLHFDTESGSQDIVDECGNTDFTIGPSAVISNADKKFGPCSFHAFSASRRLSLAYGVSPGNRFGTGNFTIEAWYKFNSVSFAQCCFLELLGTAPGDSGWAVIWDNGTMLRPTPGFIAIVMDGVNVGISQSPAPFTPNTANWYHVALVRSGAECKLFINGNQVGDTMSGLSGSVDLPGSGFYIGGVEGGPFKTDLFIDEFRISKGVARWFSNFTPPIAPYTKSN